MQTLHMPQISTVKDNGTEGTFTIEPLAKGFGVTMGNSLRRVLLSSLEGAAITGFKVAGVSHEFSSIPGVKENVVQITLNLKKLRFRVFNDEPQILQISKKGRGKVTGANIKTSADVEVVNPKQLIATLDSTKAELEMEIKVEKSRGYSPVESRQDNAEVGMISIDALFTPVKRVRYKVTPTRVGQVTGLDKLTIDISTDDSISPTEAVQQAAAMLIEQFSVIAGDERSQLYTQNEGTEETPGSDELNFSVEDLNFSPRTTNALINNKVETVRDLIELSDTELKNLKGFGTKALNEVMDKLKELELR